MMTDDPQPGSKIAIVMSGAVVILLVIVAVMAVFPMKVVEKEYVPTDAYVFEDGSFSYQFLRTLGATSYGGADIGECVYTAERIVEGDFESWCDEWTATAERIKDMGDQALADGFEISAAECYLRASNYYRTAEFYLHGNPEDPRILQLWGLSVETFIDSLDLFDIDYEQVDIAYEDTTLPGYFYKVDDSGEARATLIVMTGFDGIKEELFPYAMDAVNRGYNVLTFEGPGQGEVLRVQNLTFRPDWENVVTPAVDYLENRTDVDPDRIAIWGISMGGYLTPRAAAFEHRLAALICDGGVYDIIAGAAYEHRPDLSLSEAKEWFVNAMREEPDYFNEMYYSAMANDTETRWSIQHGMYAFGADTPVDFYLAMAEMSMIGIAGNIECPTLVCASTNDTTIPGAQAIWLYGNLTCEKTYHLFTWIDDAGFHVQVGAALQGNMVKLDWLVDVMPA